MIYGDPLNIRAMAADLDLNQLFVKQLIDQHAAPPTARTQESLGTVVPLQRR